MSKPIYLYGKVVIESIINSKARKIYQIISSDSNFINLYKKQFDTTFLDNKAITKLLPEGSVHGGYAIQCSPKDIVSVEKIIANKNKYKTIAVLDQVTDPHNVGAIIRSAVSFSVNCLIMPEHNSVIDSPTLAKSASGGLESIAIAMGNLTKILEKLKDNEYWIFGMDGKARQEVSYVNKFEYKAIVLGSEGTGIRPLVAKTCDDLIKINMTGLVESLNVSNAAAICFYEIFKDPK